MVINENGLYDATWTASTQFKRVSEGDVVGIAFGWILAVLLFYIVGLVIILKCVPLRREDSEPSRYNPSSKDKEESNPKSSAAKQSKMREEEEQQGKRRRKILESNPTTLELAES